MASFPSGAIDSDSLRQEGNRLYRSALSPGAGPVVKNARLEKAVSCYKTAALNAHSAGEKASCSKNIAVAAVALISSNIDDFCTSRKRGSSCQLARIEDEGAKSLVRVLNVALPAIGDALSLGCTCKDPDWLHGARGKFLECVKLIVAFQRGLSYTLRRERFLWKAFSLMKLLPDVAQKTPAFVKFCYEFGDFLSLSVVPGLMFDVATLKQGSDCRSGFLETALKDARLLKGLQKAQELLSLGERMGLPYAGQEQVDPPRVKEDSTFKWPLEGEEQQELIANWNDIRQLKADAAASLQLAESLQALCEGQKLVLRASEEEEFFSMDHIWLALDKFKEASLLLREAHVDVEAFVLTRLAALYEALKMEPMAHAYYTRAAQLVLSIVQLRPKLSQAWWYHHAVQEVDRHQQKQRMEEEEREQVEKEPYLEQLKDELAELKQESRKSAQALLRFVYARHPPKDASRIMGSLESESMRKTLLTAVQHYHPDKNATYGRKWQVLCEEITKVINVTYEHFK